MRHSTIKLDLVDYSPLKQTLYDLVTKLRHFKLMLDLVDYRPLKLTLTKQKIFLKLNNVFVYTFGMIDYLNFV